MGNDNTIVQRHVLGRLGARMSPYDTCIDDIIGHLRELLNTRRGDALASPTYGIEDLTDLLGNLPGSKRALIKHLADVIAEFEPRLTCVRLVAIDTHDPTRLSFAIEATLQNRDKVSMRTTIDAAGRVEVSR